MPSLEARIAARVGLRPDVKRVPMFGLGCVAGAAGIARLHDYLLGHPDEVAVLVSVELCSLTVQRDDRSVANLVASGLFGDGAAAVVAVGRTGPAPAAGSGPAGDRHPQPPVPRHRAHHGLGRRRRRPEDRPRRRGARRWCTQYLGDDVRGFLADHGLTVADVAGWVSHPGGPKVIEAIESALGPARRTPWS